MMKTPLSDPTEEVRRALAVQINSPRGERSDLESHYGRVWNSQELAAEFEVLEFAAPFVVARRKGDNKLGSLLFQHWPRYYFSFQEDK